ncbi:MAG: DUF4160 domain-containing protein [Planctomycetes bacterium]|nr:DUF4160 domain-containing protein [Planctomycetota bacterium]
MPEISRFFGIVVTMYYAEREAPHFHARYAGHKGRIAIEDLRIMDGDLPPRVRGMVIEWATLHQQELRRNWELARAQRALSEIAPLE